MELRIKDRLYFPQILPQQNTFMEFAMKREILKKVAITEEDRERFEIEEKPDEQRIVWNIEKDFAQPLEVDFSDAELEYLKKGCEKMSDKTLPDDFWNLVERIYDALNK